MDNNNLHIPQGVTVQSTEVIWRRQGPRGREYITHKVTGVDCRGIVWTWIAVECDQRYGRPKDFQKVEEAVK